MAGSLNENQRKNYFNSENKVISLVLCKWYQLQNCTKSEHTVQRFPNCMLQKIR